MVRLVEPKSDPFGGAYDITAFALACVCDLAKSAVRLWESRLGRTLDQEVLIDGLAACASFKSEALVQPHGWTIPPAWDPMAGDYLAEDGWIRLHTNYLHHRMAALRVLGCDESRESAVQSVARWKREDLESAVVAEGGCAAAMRTEQEWADHPASHLERQVEAVTGALELPSLHPGDLPLTGVKVLDLTRVLAGPECTRVLSALGAQVLRIDPPGFAEVPAVIPDMSVGKWCASLNLATPEGRRRFLDLVREAHILVIGYRAGAMEKHALDLERLKEANSNLVMARLNAYGWSGPWLSRRGFDSLVQMSSGIAARGMDLTGEDHPVPLPCQALDHGAGWVLARQIVDCLTGLIQEGRAAAPTTSLAEMAEEVKKLKRAEFKKASADFSPTLFQDSSAWGPLRRPRFPLSVEGHILGWRIKAGPLGKDRPEFSE